MSPVKRAKALGWVDDKDGYWLAGRGDETFIIVRPSLVCEGEWVFHSGSGRADGRPQAVMCAAFGTEDEALEHALLMRDVWLS